MKFSNVNSSSNSSEPGLYSVRTNTSPRRPCPVIPFEILIILFLANLRKIGLALSERFPRNMKKRFGAVLSPAEALLESI